MALKVKTPVTVGGRTFQTPWITPAISTGAYTAKDAMGTPFTVDFGCTSGIIQTIILTDMDLEDDEIDVLFFRSGITQSADNAVFDLTDSEKRLFIGAQKIAASNYFDLNDNSVACVPNVGIAFADLIDQRVTVQLVNRGAGTYAAVDDLQISFVVLQD